MESVKKIADIPLGFDELHRMLGKDNAVTNLYLYDQLGKLSYKEFMNKPCCIILIYPKDSLTKVGHFFAVIDHGSYIEHFDPYGFDLKKLFHITKQEPHLLRLYRESGKKYICNKIPFQQKREDIETCGRWCVVRIKFKNKSLKQFYKFFKETINNPDMKVSLMTYLL